MCFPSFNDYLQDMSSFYHWPLVTVSDFVHFRVVVLHQRNYDTHGRSGHLYILVMLRSNTSKAFFEVLWQKIVEISLGNSSIMLGIPEVCPIVECGFVSVLMEIFRFLRCSLQTKHIL